MGFMMFLQVFICVVLVLIVLMQSGRGGGLTEGFSSAESVFGAQTNNLMTRLTTIFAVLYFVSSISLAVVSSKKEESLMSNSVTQTIPITIPSGVDGKEDILGIMGDESKGESKGSKMEMPKEKAMDDLLGDVMKEVEEVEEVATPEIK